MQTVSRADRVVARRLAAAVAGTAFVVAGLGAQAPKLGYDDTPMQPNGKWHIHDGARPQPRVVTPGALSGPVPAPSDATVLIGTGSDLSAWQTVTGEAATWSMKDGIVETGKGVMRTKQEFTDFQLHVEFATPDTVKGDGQGRGNSGVILLGAFEIQVLDSYQNPTYPDGQAAAMYGQYPPLVNASRPPGEWQTYDIVFGAPRVHERRQAADAGDCHGLPQRRARASRDPVLGTNRAQGHQSLHRREREGADRAPGSRQPDPLPERVGQDGVDGRLKARTSRIGGDGLKRKRETYQPRTREDKSDTDPIKCV